MSEQKLHIDLRVTPQEKVAINRIAAKCGLTTSEYLRQRAIGFAPRAAAPDAFWRFCETVGELMDKGVSPEVNAELMKLIHETAEALLVPGVDRPKYAPKSQQKQLKPMANINHSWDDELLLSIDPYDYVEAG